MKVFRNEKGQITLSAMDLLNQNADINRIIGDHFMEDVQTARQVSYFMLQFQYNLRKAPKKKDNRVS